MAGRDEQADVGDRTSSAPRGNERDARPHPGAARGPEPAKPRSGALQWTTVGLLGLSALLLAANAVLAALILLSLRTTDLGGVKDAVAGVQKETAAMHADVSKSMAGLQKGLSDVADKVNSATLELNDIALSLHKRPSTP